MEFRIENDIFATYKDLYLILLSGKNRAKINIDAEEKHLHFYFVIVEDFSNF